MMLASAPLKRITRSLGTLTIDLFEQYPENFPRAVSLHDLGGPLTSWFRVDRVCIVRVRLPERSGSYIRETHWGFTSTFAPPKESATSGLVVGLGFDGDFDAH